jgi:hypothetical protein
MVEWAQPVSRPLCHKNTFVTGGFDTVPAFGAGVRPAKFMQGYSTTNISIS